MPGPLTYRELLANQEHAGRYPVSYEAAHVEAEHVLNLLQSLAKHRPCSLCGTHSNLWTLFASETADDAELWSHCPRCKNSTMVLPPASM
jgi:hypothetical protein